MYLETLTDPRTFSFISNIDKDLEQSAAKKPCRFCGSKMHRAYYMRKPRYIGTPLPESYGIRPSFCCSIEGCRRRYTPDQIRFLARKVYLSFVVVLISAMNQGLCPKKSKEISNQLKVPKKTLRRWLNWWTTDFSSSKRWQYEKGNFMPPVNDADLPNSFIRYFTYRHIDLLSVLKNLIAIALKSQFWVRPNLHFI